MKTDAPRAARGPGLAKTRCDRLFLRRAVLLWTSAPGAMADYVRTADVLSEGEVREEGGRRTYFGSTSLLLLPGPRTQALGPSELRDRLSNDPHVRLLALRIAVREATHRAGAELGSASTEIAFREGEGGVIVTVDVSVPLHASAKRTG